MSPRHRTWARLLDAALPENGRRPRRRTATTMALALIAPFITLLATPVSAEAATAAEPAFKVAAAALLQPSAPAAKPAPPDARFNVLVVRSTQDAVSSAGLAA